MGIPMLDSDGKAACNEANAEVCIYCGHCVAVCPVKAVSLTPAAHPENLAEMQDYGIVPLSLTPDACKPTELGQAAHDAQLPG